MTLEYGQIMKKEFSELQAPLLSSVSAKSYEQVENPSLHIKLQEEFSLPRNESLQGQASDRASIVRLRFGVHLPVTDSESDLLH